MSTTDGSGNQRAAGRLAQLLGETIVHHAPWTADIDQEARWRHTNQWLDGLEAHTAGLVGPLLQRALDESDPPDEIKALLQEAIAPTAAFSAILEQIFLYGIVSQLISTSLQPFMQGVVNQLSTSAVASGISRPLDPATIATAAARGLEKGAKPTVTMPAWAASTAAENGMSEEDINLLASIVGLPPALQELFELYRRGVITVDEVKVGLKEGDFRDDWVDRAVKLAHTWLTPDDFVRAAVQEQMTYGDARTWAEKTGLDVSTNLPVDTGGTAATPDMFGLAYAISGRPPGPVQLGDMALRKIIGWHGTGADATTFQQGIAESDVKTKWTPALEQLMQYVPPPGTIGTLLERGAITKQQAEQYWEQRGVPPELAKGYAYVAEQQHIGQDKLLARTDITTALYDGIFTRQEAVDMLDLLGYRGQVADDIVEITQFRREIRSINAVVSRVESLYGSYRLDATHAKTALTTVGIGSEQADTLLKTWDVLRVTPIRLPTAREIGRAVKAGTITNPEGLVELERLGYEPRDAAIVLSSYSGAPVSPLPAPGGSVTGAAGL